MAAAPTAPQESICSEYFVDGHRDGLRSAPLPLTNLWLQCTPGENLSLYLLREVDSTTAKLSGRIIKADCIFYFAYMESSGNNGQISAGQEQTTWGECADTTRYYRRFERPSFQAGWQDIFPDSAAHFEVGIAENQFSKSPLCLRSMS